MIKNRKRLQVTSLSWLIIPCITLAEGNNIHLQGNINPHYQLLISLWHTFPAITGYFQGLCLDEMMSEISKIVEYCFYKKSIIDCNIPAMFSGSEEDITAIETLFTLFPDLMSTVLQLIGG